MLPGIKDGGRMIYARTFLKRDRFYFCLILMSPRLVIAGIWILGGVVAAPMGVAFSYDQVSILITTEIYKLTQKRILNILDLFSLVYTSPFPIINIWNDPS